MKRFVPVAALLAVADAVAHPGHGKSGFIHFHEFTDGLVIVIGLAVAGLLYWAWKK